MATHVEFKRIVSDVAKLEGSSEFAIGTTGFAGDGDRLFLQVDGKGILFTHADAEAFLLAAQRCADRLEIKDE